MSWLGDVFDFEKSALNNKLGKKDLLPQVLLGAADPVGGKFWSGVTGHHYSPLLNGLGGATSDDYKQARSEGIDTRAGHGMHKLAQVIALYKVGSWLGGLAGAGGAGAEAGGGAGAEAGGGAGGGMGGGGMWLPSGGQEPQQQQPNPWLEQNRAELERRRLLEAMLQQRNAQ